MNDIYIFWTGKAPNLCSGRWILKVNNHDFSFLIENKKEMNTLNEYIYYYCDETIDYYESGLDCKDWIKENEDWLDIITDNDKEKEYVFKLIQKQDWRRNSCGGCL